MSTGQTKRLWRLDRKLKGYCRSCYAKLAIIPTNYCDSCITKKRETAKLYYIANKTQRSEYRTDRQKKLRQAALYYYSNGTMQCVCPGCPETLQEFLTIDHIDGAGAAHRKTMGRGQHIAEWLQQNNYPDGFQVLCWNCNCAKHLFGECPHLILIETPKCVLEGRSSLR